jgi:hypothetical protein
MPIGILFWALMIIALVFDILASRNPQWGWGVLGNKVFLWLLLFLLGWGVFGFILQRSGGGPL